MVQIKFSIIAVALGVVSVNAQISTWVTNETSISYTRMYSNVQPAGTAAGCVIASPSTSNPNYYYSWVRDSAMTLKVAINQYNTTRVGDSTLVSIIKNYVTFSRNTQTESTPCR